ncbi:MAG TPA: hypothetical protein VG826_14135 [Pirellulales bacterium]|nr:hypothetical protein [Pirellulales bacterium]
MRRMTICAAVIAAALWSPTAFAGEKIQLPNGPSKASPQVTTAVERGEVPVTNVDWARRAWRNGWYGGYSPYYSYRPYFGTYAPYYGGYYTRPYYGYSYYSPGWSYGGWGPGVSVGVGPMAYGRIGGWYW